MDGIDGEIHVLFTFYSHYLRYSWCCDFIHRNFIQSTRFWKLLYHRLLAVLKYENMNYLHLIDGKTRVTQQCERTIDIRL